MPDLLHFVPIDAPAEKAFEALTTRDGLRGWWTADAEAEPKEGSDAVFGFDGRQVVFRMRVAELVRNERVRWECVGDQPEWKGTTLTWEIAPADEGVSVKLLHAGWKSPTDFMASCNSMWGHLMFRLKDYAEGKGKNPRWKE